MERKMTCELCKKEFTARSPKAKFCSAYCRKRAHRGAAVVQIRPVVVLPNGRDEDPAALIGVQAATYQALDAVGRVSSPAGAAALLLAARLDAGGDTGSAMATLTKELRASLAEALEGVPPVADTVDQLRARREARLRGANA